MSTDFSFPLKYPDAHRSVAHQLLRCSYLKALALIDRTQGVVTCRTSSYKYGQDAFQSQHVNHFSILADCLPLLPVLHLDRLTWLQDHLAALVVKKGPKFVRTAGLGRDIALQIESVQIPCDSPTCKGLTALAPSYLTGSTSSLASKPLRETLPYFSLTVLSFRLYSARKAAFLSFSDMFLVGTSCHGAAPSSSVVGWRWMTGSWAVIGEATRSIVIGAAVSVLTGASLVEIGMKPGGRGTVFSLPVLGDSSISMSVSLVREVGSLADALLDRAFS